MVPSKPFITVTSMGAQHHDDPLFHTYLLQDGKENTGKAPQSPSPLPRQDFTWPVVDVSVTLVTALHKGKQNKKPKERYRPRQTFLFYENNPLKCHNLWVPQSWDKICFLKQFEDVF